MIDDKNLMKDDMVSKLAILLSHDKKISSIAEALDIVVNSETYQRLMDDKTALYYQSPRYVYTFLITELTTGNVG